MNSKAMARTAQRTTSSKSSPKKPGVEDGDILLKINEDRLAMFLKGLENYEFKIHKHPDSYKQPMDSKKFFKHLYGVLQLYVEEETEKSEIGRMLVLYGVRAFEQKKQTNIFLVSFLYALDQFYYESPEAEFAIELINSFSDDPELVKKKLRKWLSIKESIVMHYTEDPQRIDTSLDPVIVNCNEWANLFKSLNYLFNNYETQMIKRLIEKLKQLGVEETNNVLGSIFAKAVFLLHENLLNEEAVKMANSTSTSRQIGTLAAAEENLKVSRDARLKGLKELKANLEKEKKKHRDTSATLARKAQREGQGEVEHVEVTTTEKGKKIKKDDLMQRKLTVNQELETLDDKIYREGREKRNLQELLDLANYKLKENSRSYDELFDLTVKLCKDYKKLLDYGQEYYPETVQGLPRKDFSLLKKFETNANIYQKSQKLDLNK